MKVILSVASVAAFLVIAVVMVRALLLVSRQEPAEPYPPIVVRPEAAERLAAAIRFRTVSYQPQGSLYQDPNRTDAEEFLRLHAYLQQAFPRVHATLSREVVNRYSLLYTWPGSREDLKPVLVSGHLDVVPVAPGSEGRWTHPPFAGAIADSYIWGRGSMDMKLAVVGVLEAIEALLDEGYSPQRTIYLAFGHDEEVEGLAGAVQIAALLAARGVSLDYVLDEGLVITHGVVPGVDAPVALIGIAEKGYLSVELRAECEGGHVYAPPPQTCVGIVGSAIQKLEGHPLRASLDGPVGLLLDFIGPEMSFPYKLAFGNRWAFSKLIEDQFAASAATNASIRTTMAATLTGGGVKENVLPQDAWAIVNFRLRPGDSTADVMEHVRATIADPRITMRSLDSAREASPVSALAAPSFQALARTIRQVFPDAIVAPSLLIGATDSRHYTGLTDSIYRFLPQRMGPGDIGRVHGTDERVAVENYAEIIQFYAQLIRNCCGT